jgi:2-oxoglutarate ferredoxin oxidoreductase subunit delta
VTTQDAIHRQPLNLESAQTPKGQVYVLPNRCKGCGYCIEFCPEDVLVFSSDINAKGYTFPIVQEGKESACVHCQFCNLVCPDLAIYTQEVTD